MSEQQSRAFREAIQVDEELKKKLANAVDIHAFAAIANAAGFLVSTEELAGGGFGITDDDLKDINGGNLAHCP